MIGNVETLIWISISFFWILEMIYWYIRDANIKINALYLSPSPQDHLKRYMEES
jgi:hypothetical protein